MAHTLLEWETLNSEQIDDIMAGKEPRPPQGTDDSDGSAKTEKPKVKKPKIKPSLDKPAGEH